MLPMSLAKTAKFLVAALLIAAALAAQCGGIRDFIGLNSDCGHRVLVECPIAWRRGGVAIPISIFRETHFFLVDTGCTATILDSQFKDRLGPPRDSTMKIDAVGHSIREPTFEAPAMSIGNFALPRMPWAFCLDFGRLRDESGGLCCEGIIGLDALRRFVVHVDPDADQLRLLNSVPHDPGEAITFEWGAYEIYINVRIAGLAPRPFVLDTGTLGRSCVLLDGTSYDALLASQAIEPEPSEESVCLAGKFTRRGGIVDRIQIGRRVQLQVPVAQEAKCVIGAACLFERYEVIFDFPGGRIFLKDRESRGEGPEESPNTSAGQPP